jgi:hypothetical protein
VKALRLFLLLAGFAAAGCGSGASAPVAPTSPPGTSAQLLPPTVLKIPSQRIDATSNEVTFTWVSSEPGFQLVIGTSSGSSNVLNKADLTSPTFTWTSPRAAGTYYARVAAKRGDATSHFSDEIAITIVDVRNMIEAMFFHTGPMSDATEGGGTSNVAALWADGTALTVSVSPAAGEIARANAQTFADQYAALVDSAITAQAIASSSEFNVSDDRPELRLDEFNIGIRVQAGFCKSGALACANYGPAPAGPNRSMITFALAGPLNVAATAHEMGHAYGMGHIQSPAMRSEFRFMMNSNAGAAQMTDAEKLAIRLARSGGLRPGMTRSEAADKDLIVR